LEAQPLEDTMKRHLVKLTFLALALTLATGTRAPAQIASRQVVCPPVTISEGWIKVDVISTPSICGGNAWVLETTNNKAPGSAMMVCADQPTPAGWETLGIATNSGQCAGDRLSGDNVKTIRRIG
jgi:hypothetical protein